MYTMQEKIWPTRHVRFPRQSTYARRMLPMCDSHTRQHFTPTQQSWTDSLLPRKSALDSTSQPGWVVHGTHLSFSLNTAIEAVRLSQTSVDNRLLGLPGPYHQHAIDTFNTCSRVPIPQSLTDIDGGYHIEKPQNSPSLPRVPLIPLMAPPGLRLSAIITNWTGEGTSPKSHEWEPPLDFYHNLPSKNSITNDKPPQDGGNKDKSKRSVLMQLECLPVPIDLMLNQI
jgi:hypothetical protein